jgi:hypothetical protein
MGTTFIPLPMGHVEVRIDSRPPKRRRPAVQPPVRDSGPVEGVWGNREVPQAPTGDGYAH